MDPLTTLKEAREWFFAAAVKGTHCPCCQQHGQVYRRKLNSGMARALIRFYRYEKKGKQDRWMYWRLALAPIGSFCTEYSMLEFWELIERKPHEPKTKTKDSGYWRMTMRGRLFVEGRTQVRSHRRIYNKKILERYGPYIHIQDALTDHFNYKELMTGAMPEEED